VASPLRKEKIERILTKGRSMQLSNVQISTVDIGEKALVVRGRMRILAKSSRTSAGEPKPRVGAQTRLCRDVGVPIERSTADWDLMMWKMVHRNATALEVSSFPYPGQAYLPFEIEYISPNSSNLPGYDVTGTWTFPIHRLPLKLFNLNLVTARH
jgi:hypothetical protein